VSSRSTFHVDIHALIVQGDTLLLGERSGTGWMDGHHHLVAGHLEDGESATTALIREVREEAGIEVVPEKVRLAHVRHHRTEAGRVALFFEVTAWEGTIVNAEPDKCAGWEFHRLDALPELMIPYARDAIELYGKGVTYSEGGWQ
jgi:ADP-ribose pyrophosphatase YjhB (NUDIX family)